MKISIKTYKAKNQGVDNCAKQRFENTDLYKKQNKMRTCKM